MNIDDFRNYKKITESERIHEELFHKTSEYDYYNLGVATGLYAIYNTFLEYENLDFNSHDILEIIKFITRNNEFTEYFDRLIKNSESEN